MNASIKVSKVTTAVVDAPRCMICHEGAEEDPNNFLGIFCGCPVQCGVSVMHRRCIIQWIHLKADENSQFGPCTYCKQEYLAVAESKICWKNVWLDLFCFSMEKVPILVLSAMMALATVFLVSMVYSSVDSRTRLQIYEMTFLAAWWVYFGYGCCWQRWQKCGGHLCIALFVFAQNFIERDNWLLPSGNTLIIVVYVLDRLIYASMALINGGPLLSRPYFQLYPRIILIPATHQEEYRDIDQKFIDRLQ
jgi:hypothetical protein